jgi:SPP1 family predicted phage head-tail adaptor
MINAGKYRHKITIRNPAAESSRDEFGGRKGTGATVATVFAEKQDWGGGELNEANRETATVTTKWKIRYRTGILPKMQVVHGSDVYDIMNVLDFDGTLRELVLESRKVVA